MHTVGFASIFAGAEPLVWNLASGLTSTFGDVEPPNGRNTILVGFDRGEGSVEPTAKRTYDAGGDDGDPEFRGFSTGIVKSFHPVLNWPAILIAFQIAAPYTIGPKGENSSSEVRQLSFRRCSRRFEI
jgi:hypothetical protein